MTLLVMGRTLTAAGYGLFSIVMGYVYVANLLIEPRMQDVAARQFWQLGTGSSDHREYGPYVLDLFLLESLAKLIPCAALLLVAPWLTSSAGLPAETSLLIMFAAAAQYLSRLGNGLSTGLLRVLGRSDYLALCTTGEIALRLAAIATWAWLGELTVGVCVGILCACGLVANTAMGVLTARQLAGLRNAWSEWHPSAAFSRLRVYRGLLLSNMGLSVADLMNKDLDVTLMSPIVPADQVGLYKMAKSITLLAWRAVDPFYLALMPEVTRLVSMQRFGDLRRLLARSAVGLLALAIALALVLYIALSSYAETILGPGYGQTPYLMLWMLLSVVASAPLVWGHPLAVALNRPGIALAGSFLGSALGLCSFVVLVPQHGALGAAWAWAITFATNATFTAVVSRRLLATRTTLSS
ncbi:MAG: hypothetical protein U1E89_11475 [Burkholderiaceae bacterium]